MKFDPEIKAMNDCLGALKDLEEDARARVLFWLNRKFLGSNQKGLDTSALGDTGEQFGLRSDFNSFTSVAEVFSQANPKTASDKVLIVAAYLQAKEEKGELTSREISNELNHLGHGVSNITNAISGLINRKPCLMIQTRKKGKSQQAQKKYKVTTEGLKAAIGMLNDSTSE